MSSVSNVAAVVGSVSSVVDPLPKTSADAAEFDRWRRATRAQVLRELEIFLEHHRVESLREVGADDVLAQYVLGGKCLRSTFMYLGWLCGESPDPAALRAAASLELLHAFALLQDDVMDDGALRRGSPTAHFRLARRYRERQLPGAASQFGVSAATLLSDMCLVWAEQLMRRSGLHADALARTWDRYDAMRIELAVGQLADLTNDARTAPTQESVLAIARAKSGNYTVRRPLELGAALAGCSDSMLRALGDYGSRIGEAFQLHDDLLGVFGSPATTGKPEDSDLGQRKATTVVVVALERAAPAAQRELLALLDRPTIDTAAIARCRLLIAESGAREHIELMINDRIEAAVQVLDGMPLDPTRSAALHRMALLCSGRQA